MILNHNQQIIYIFLLTLDLTTFSKSYMVFLFRSIALHRFFFAVDTINPAHQNVSRPKRRCLTKTVPMGKTQFEN